MRAIRAMGCALMLLTVLAGCALIRGTPTPIPWIDHTPTVAVEATSEQLLPGTATAVPDATATATPLPATPSPTIAPTVTPAAAPLEQQIVLEEPRDGVTVANPVRVRGRTALMPFEGTLVIYVLDAAGQRVAQQPLIADGEYGGPAAFDALVHYGGAPGAGRIEVVEYSAEDGSVIASTSVGVTLGGFTGGGYVEIPAALSRITLPVGLVARVGTPDERVTITLAWHGVEPIEVEAPVLRGRDGRGLVISAFGPQTLAPAPISGTWDAAIQIHSSEGNMLAWQPVTILGDDHPETMSTQVFWVVGEQVVAQRIRIPRTLGVGRASLEALLWGPVPGHQAGYTSAIPGPAEVLLHPQRSEAWGERVRLLSLTIQDGVARADFSPEMSAHSGGSLRVLLIRQQIEQTLLQFPTVNQVVITVGGRSDMLEP